MGTIYDQFILPGLGGEEEGGGILFT